MSLGTVVMPATQSFESSSSVVKRCTDYATAKALDDFKTSGKISTPDTLQADVDTCSASIDRGRMIRQLLIMSFGLGAVGYVGYHLWRAA